MITLRRNTDRRLVRQGLRRRWLTFYPPVSGGLNTDHFGLLIDFTEIRLPPGVASNMEPGRAAERITYLYRGSLAHENSTGVSGVIYAGEFQIMIVGRGVRYKEANPSPTKWTHVFRITLRPSVVDLDSVQVQMRFPTAERHNLLCVVASPDGRRNSLKILQDAVICSSILTPGRHIVHELPPGRSAWLHVIHGEIILKDIIMSEGDGAGVEFEPSVSLTAQVDSEILLIDLGQTPRAGEQ